MQILKLIVALVFFVSPAFAKKESKSETYKDIIEKAQNLSLQKDRQQAVNILLAALKKETKPSAVLDIKRSILDMSHMFLSDKAQQLYESAISLKKNDLNQGLDKIGEAHKLEPDNLKIVLEQSRMLMRKDDCRSGVENLYKFLRLEEIDEDLALAHAQGLACLSKWTEVVRLSELHKKKHLEVYWGVLDVERLIFEKSFIRAQELLNHVGKLDPAYPELSYWEFRLRQLQKLNVLDAGVKYLANCKNISAVQYRKYMIDPMLCSRVQFVESEMKNANGI